MIEYIRDIRDQIFKIYRILPDMYENSEMFNNINLQINLNQSDKLQHSLLSNIISYCVSHT